MKAHARTAGHAILSKLAPSYYNDQFLRPARQSYAGNQPKGAKIAIFLIFPRFGVLESHIHSLKYMVENGYSAFVLSNLPLSNDDIARLKPFAWRIVQRANFGYDFGGYRDGILDLQDMLPNLQRLVLLNDSCWFPIKGCKNWLRCAEDSNDDIYGANFVGDLTGFTPRNYESAIGKKRESGRRLHYGAFALSIGPNALQHDGFLKFWSNLRLSNGRGRTSRRGEQGFTRWLLGTNLRHGALGNSFSIWEDVLAMTRDEFNRIWAHLIVLQLVSATRAAKLKLHKEVDDADLPLSKQFVGLQLARSAAEFCIPLHMINVHGYPFLKKNIYHKVGPNQATLATIIQQLDDPQSSNMLKEHLMRFPGA